MNEAPMLVVVGHVNKGKSSIVAALTESSDVRIAPKPRTTVDVREYPIVIDGETVLRLADTPGFQHAPRALHVIGDDAPTAADRPAAIARFVDRYRDTGEFVDEVRLLGPVVDGGGILYVVDATKPYRARFEAEMEILRWTGQPRMALMNRIGDGDHFAEWRAALSQYFDRIEVFDAHAATFAQCVDVFASFEWLRSEWRPAIQRALAALRSRRSQRNLEAAALIADLVADAVSYVRETPMPRGQSPARFRRRLYDEYHEHVAELERKTRRRVEKLDGHRPWARGGAPGDPAPFEEALFGERSWKTLGLPPKALVGLAAAVGATVGAVADASVGGASFGTGLLLGGVTGAGTAAVHVGRRYAEVSSGGALGGLVGVWRSNPRLTIGPHPNPNLPWVLLDRALAHAEVVRNWSHARRGERPKLHPDSAGASTPPPSDLSGPEGFDWQRSVVRSIDIGAKHALEKLFRKVRKNDAAARAELQGRVAELLSEPQARS